MAVGYTGCCDAMSEPHAAVTSEAIVVGSGDPPFDRSEPSEWSEGSESVPRRASSVAGPSLLESSDATSSIIEVG